MLERGGATFDLNGYPGPTHDLDVGLHIDVKWIQRAAPTWAPYRAGLRNVRAPYKDFWECTGRQFQKISVLLIMYLLEADDGPSQAWGPIKLGAPRSCGRSAALKPALVPPPLLLLFNCFFGCKKFTFIVFHYLEKCVSLFLWITQRDISTQCTNSADQWVFQCVYMRINISVLL